MCVMNVEIDRGSSGLGRIGHLGGPIGAGDDPLEMAAEQFAIPLGLDCTGCELEFRNERKDMGYHQQSVRFLGLGEHLIGLMIFEGDCLFYEHMLSREGRRSRSRDGRGWDCRCR